MTAPYYADDTVTLYAGDCLDALPTLPDASVDAVVCDPPYGLTELSTTKVLQAIAAWMAGDRTHVPDGRGFMGREWDQFVPPPGVWDECLRVLKPGGHLLAFSGARTVDLMTLSIRIAGFEIRESIAWTFGSGFPKSLDVSKAIDKAAGAEREVVGDKLDRPGYHLHGHDSGTGAFGGGVSVTTPETRLRAAQITAAATDDARRWSGFGTALKPAHEPIVLARKPLAGTVAGNVLTHGTGALNIDACRVGDNGGARRGPDDVGVRGRPNDVLGAGLDLGNAAPRIPGLGRWPTNVVLTHQPLIDDTGNIIGDACEHGCVPGCPVADMDAQSGTRTSWMAKTNYTVEPSNEVYGKFSAQPVGPQNQYGDTGGASRFFPVFRYEAKAPSSERPRAADGTAHATVKPLALMRWLVRLATQPGGVVLDPFLGSGTTAEACVIEGFRCIGIERDETHLPLIKARLSKPIQPALGFEDAS